MDINVLANDTDIDNTLTAAGITITQGTNGTATVVAGKIRYTPNANTNGTHTFTYQVCDTATTPLCDTATVTITVTAVNDAPVANGDTASTTKTTPVDIDVLANDTDVESGKPTTSVIVTPPAKGTAVTGANGSIRYTANVGACGSDSFTYRASDGSASSAPATVSVTISCPVEPPTAGGGSEASPITALTPARFYDSRPAATVDGQQSNQGRRGAATTTVVNVAGRNGVPVGAIGAVVNVVAISPSAGGYFTVYPCGTTRPEASTLNFAAGQTIANGATIKLGPDGTVCVYTDQAADLIVDVTGYIPQGSTVGTVVPARLHDTRPAATIDGKESNTGRRTSGSITTIQVAGRGQVPTNASAATLNIAAINTAAPGYMTVYPCGTTRPEASTLNFAAGQTIANGATIKLGPDGTVCVYTDQAADLIVDVTGYIPQGSTVGTVVPARLHDTRPAATIDGKESSTGRRTSGSITTIQVAGRGQVPTNASAATLNIAAINTAAPGYMTVYPCGTTRPEASTLNFAAGQTIANGATIKLGPDGTVCVYTDQAADLIVDVTGYIS